MTVDFMIRMEMAVHFVIGIKLPIHSTIGMEWIIIKMMIALLHLLRCLRNPRKHRMQFWRQTSSRLSRSFDVQRLGPPREMTFRRRLGFLRQRQLPDGLEGFPAEAFEPEGGDAAAAMQIDLCVTLYQMELGFGFEEQRSRLFADLNLHHVDGRTGSGRS